MKRRCEGKTWRLQLRSVRSSAWKRRTNDADDKLLSCRDKPPWPSSCLLFFLIVGRVEKKEKKLMPADVMKEEIDDKRLHDLLSHDQHYYFGSWERRVSCQHLTFLLAGAQHLFPWESKLLPGREKVRWVSFPFLIHCCLGFKFEIFFVAAVEKEKITWSLLSCQGILSLHHTFHPHFVQVHRWWKVFRRRERPKGMREASFIKLARQNNLLEIWTWAGG